MIVFRHMFFLTIIALISPPCFALHKPFMITQSGVAKAGIVIQEGAPVAEQTAAKELSWYLKQITGADFPVYSPTTSPAGMPRIHVGQSDESKKFLKNIDWNKLKFDGIIIKFIGNDLVLAGDRPRGTLYAVYTFLEDYLGCRWWTPKANKIPLTPNLSVMRAYKTHIPPFIYREAYYAPVIQKNPVFASRLKLNGTNQSIFEEYGGHYRLLGFVHTADKFLPVSQYFNSHPEWFSLINGKRVGGQTEGQLCLSNEEMKTEFIKQALIQIEKDPSAGMISISQNDNFNYCQCEKCTKIVNETGGQSGVLIWFVNSVADQIAKKYPEFLVETLAYLYTRHAPKHITPRDNVIVRLCSIECDFASPLNSDSNASFYKDLHDWKKISKRLYVWDYVVNFSNLSIGHPNWRALAPNIRIFAANNVVGLFEQGDSQNSGVSFGHMKTWVLSHLMWNPAIDAHNLMKEFATGYYGPAAPYILHYIDLTCDAVEKSDMQLGCFAGSNLDYLKQSDMDKANELFDKAEKSVANNSDLLNRVRIERLALDHTWILQTQLDRSRVGVSRGMDMKAVCDDFIRRSESTGNNSLNDAGTMTASYYNDLRYFASVNIPKTKPSTAIPVAARGLKPSQWIDIQDSRMNLNMPGTNAFIVGDKDASDGRAIRMPGNQADWSTQIHLDKTQIKSGTQITVYVSVKTKLNATSGLAFTIGIYDKTNGKFMTNQSVMIEDIKDSNYHDYNLGTYKMEQGWYIYVVAPGDGKLVADVYVDRGFVVKTVTKKVRSRRTM